MVAGSDFRLVGKGKLRVVGRAPHLAGAFLDCFCQTSFWLESKVNASDTGISSTTETFFSFGKEKPIPSHPAPQTSIF